ncbi:GNAT family N-acetyltransferase [Frigoribacterium sp. PvP032]|uniref:GNAT family N-acetyltransferase n=1 Tax=Frigoribacterium sp. PvP032 TaxID=2806589 RepID=UPI0027DB3255|nr:GNAT family N-acetyltransferase [Frigoribacterium sp. PvP032]
MRVDPTTSANSQTSSSPPSSPTSGARASGVRPTTERDSSASTCRTRRGSSRPGGRVLGCLAVHPDGDDVWLRHFYLAEEARGRGIGTRLLMQALASLGPRPVLLDVLSGSRAANLYLRHGFVPIEDDGVDVIMRRDPGADVPPQARTDSAEPTGS